MNDADIRKRLEQLVEKHKTQVAAAASIGVTLAYFNDVLHGRRKPGPSILKALGLRKGYERI